MCGGLLFVIGIEMSDRKDINSLERIKLDHEERSWMDEEKRIKDLKEKLLLEQIRKL